MNNFNCLDKLLYKYLQKKKMQSSLFHKLKSNYVPQFLEKLDERVSIKL